MKKGYVAGVVLIVLVAVLLGMKPGQDQRTEPVVEMLPHMTGTQCYHRSVQATEEAPYAVEEDIVIMFDGDAVTGTKSGTQAGPDMTNGYEGTLSGTRTGDALSLLFNYTIEGSRQSEQEEYVVKGENIVKQRYPLIEKEGILVPDTTKEFVLQEYVGAPCSIVSTQ